MLRQRLTILGATGSIGVNTLDVVRRHPERFQVLALSAYRQIELLFEQCLEFRPRFAVLNDEVAAISLQKRLCVAGVDTEVLHGPDALKAIAVLPDVEIVMAAIVGSAGLPSALAAAQAGKKILLANKEALVMAGPVFMAAVRESGAVLLPIDSEHNAIFQSLPAGFRGEMEGQHGVRKLLLTASGGPFRRWSIEALSEVTPAEAVAHPNWVMGRKISVDSATLMNKGLEVIEAYWLFNVPVDRIEVVVHPQSIIHSMVEYVDGSVLAQLGNPDMRTPIAYALAFPERIDSGVSPLDLMALGRLDFEPPDLERFPCLELAFQALRIGGSAPTVLNAANEVAVQAFLAGVLRFTRIPDLVAATLDALPVSTLMNLDQVLAVDMQARDYAKETLLAWGARC